MNEPAKIDTVISILVWDAYEAVLRLLDNLSRGVARKTSYRLFILDQGSQSPTADALAQFSATHKSWVHLERIPKNIGYPAGHNRLHRLACERYDFRHFVTINSDVTFHEPTWLDRLVHFMDGLPRVGIAGPTGVIYQRTPPERIGWCRTSTAEELQRGEFDSISGSVCILRQEMIESIGLFDESFTPGYYEDTDLAFRAKTFGWHLAICPLPHGHHDLGADKSTAQIKREELAAQYGNFQKRHRDLFVQRWLSDGQVPRDIEQIAELYPNIYIPASLVSC